MRIFLVLPFLTMLGACASAPAETPMELSVRQPINNFEQLAPLDYYKPELYEPTPVPPAPVYNEPREQFQPTQRRGADLSSTQMTKAEVERPNLPAGEIFIDTPAHYLYYGLGGGKALRYGIRVGRPGFKLSGVHTVSAKKEWPDWHPPAEMREREPWLPAHMEGGVTNPLGARALYLGSTLYRIHGTNKPWTIGQNVSSGCIGMMNADVIDLYSRVPVGAQVVVR